MKRNRLFVQTAHRAAGMLAAVLTLGLIFVGCSGKENAQSGSGGGGTAKIKNVKAGGVTFVELPYGDDGEISYVPKSVYDAYAEIIGLQISHINRVKVLTQKEANEYKQSLLANGEAFNELDSDKTLAALEKLVDADNNTVAENQEIGNRMRVAFNVLNNLFIFFNDFVPETEGSVPLEEDLARVILTNRARYYDNYVATPIMDYSSPGDYFKYLGKYFPTVKFDYTRTIDWMLTNAKTAEDVNGIKKIVAIPSVQLNKEQQAQYDVLFERFRPVLEALENGFETKPSEDGSGMVIVKYTGPGGNIVIPEGAVSFDNGVFRSNQSLTSVKIPDSVTTIGDGVFLNCENLTTINIPDSVTSIGDEVFASCYNLTTINIPDGVTSIGKRAFASCYNLTTINIPDSVTSIGYMAFNSCSSLTSINIPDGVTSIEAGAFYDCSSLTSINIPDGVTSIVVGAFYDCSSLTSIKIPDGVTSIGSEAFAGCENLTTINIPDSVTWIEQNAFSGCDKLDTASKAAISKAGYRW